jgi:hypothetical protein
MASRFRFHGFAIGAAGRINKPVPELIEVQAATALPQIGGHGDARSANFKFRELLQFDLAHCEVTGTKCSSDDDDEPVFHTRITSTVEGLNIMEMVTADRVVATLGSTYTSGSDGEPSVRLIGTRFENLRIAGIPVEVDIATDVFDRYDTHRALTAAYIKDKDVHSLVDKLCLKHRAEEAPAHILRWFHFGEGEELPASRGITAISLVRGFHARGGGLDPWGHVIHVPGFGTVRLAQLEISKRTRNVTMIEVDIDCAYEGTITVCSVSDGGDDY